LEVEPDALPHTIRADHELAFAPQFSSSQADISMSRCPSPSGGTPMRMRTGQALLCCRD
jgi:hypothetical protein